MSKVSNGWREAMEHVERMMWLRRENLPAELVHGRLVLSEQEIRTTLPVPLHGIPDQVFETDAAMLVPTDTKNRRVPVVYMSDIVQLSVYGTILAFSQDARLRGRQVAGYGYVRLPTLAGVVWARVPLLPTARVVEIWADYCAQQHEVAALAA